MRPVWGFIWILIITLLLLTAYSFAPFTLKIGKLEIKKTDFKRFLLGDTTKIEALAASDIFWKKLEVDTSKKVILLFGDSMLEQLRYPFYDYCRYNGHKLYVVIWYAATSQWLGNSDTLRYYIEKLKPNYLVIVLGANELFVKNIEQKRSRQMKHILEQIDTLPYIWVGPPNWREDYGTNQMYLRYVGRGRFFPTYKLSLNNPRFTRFKDGAHPTYEAACLWMDSLAYWIMHYSRYPIKLERPPFRTKQLPRTFVLQPLKD